VGRPRISRIPNVVSKDNFSSLFDSVGSDILDVEYQPSSVLGLNWEHLENGSSRSNRWNGCHQSSSLSLTNYSKYEKREII